MCDERPYLTNPDEFFGPLAQPPPLSAEEVRAVHFKGRIPTFRNLVGLWREDRKRHRGSFFSPGFQALAVHRYGVWARGLKPSLALQVFCRLHIMIN